MANRLKRVLAAEAIVEEQNGSLSGRHIRNNIGTTILNSFEYYNVSHNKKFALICTDTEKASDNVRRGF